MASKKLLALFIFPTLSFVTAQLFNIRGDTSLLNGQRLRDKFTMGVFTGKNIVCNITGTTPQEQGICTSTLECAKSSGRVRRKCPFLGSCCVYEGGCSNATSAKISYFVSPNVQNTQTSTCIYRVIPYNRNVCQLRLDFENFNLAPRQTGSSTCNVDRFTVTGSSQFNLGFEALCGFNTGQHIYIPVGPGQPITLNVALDFLNRPAESTLNPTWRIKVTQLECPINSDFSSFQSTLTTMFQRHKSQKYPQSFNDQALLAPSGCLQYYPEPTGTYTSFGYQVGVDGASIGRMPPNTDYAICFNRSPNVCGIRHSVGEFKLGECDCQIPTCMADQCTRDFLHIPGPLTIPTPPPQGEYFCSSFLQAMTVQSNNAGPLWVNVRTDNTSCEADPERGFSVNYQVINC